MMIILIMGGQYFMPYLDNRFLNANGTDLSWECPSFVDDG